MHSRLRSTTVWSLVVLAIFQALSAIGGGVGILATNGLGMPASLLASGPFTTFVWPGVILLVVIGGTQALAAVLLLRRREGGLLWSAIAGFGMVIWIFVETGMIGGTSVLQFLYFTTGTLQLVLVFALLGIVTWLPRQVPNAVGGRSDSGHTGRYAGSIRHH